MSEDDFKKLKILDSIFNTMTADELSSIFGEHLTAMKLKGAEVTIGPLEKAFMESTCREVQINKLETDIFDLRTDITTVIRYLDNLAGDSHIRAEFETLKYRRGIY